MSDDASIAYKSVGQNGKAVWNVAPAQRVRDKGWGRGGPKEGEGA